MWLAGPLLVVAILPRVGLVVEEEMVVWVNLVVVVVVDDTLLLSVYNNSFQRYLSSKYTALGHLRFLHHLHLLSLLLLVLRFVVVGRLCLLFCRGRYPVFRCVACVRLSLEWSYS